MTVEQNDEREAVRRVFAGLTEDELREAVIQFREYFTIAAEICGRERKSVSLLPSTVDSCGEFSTMEERSNDSLKS